MVLMLLGGIFALLTLLVLGYGFNVVSRWKLRQIPGPRPRFLFGNLIDVPFGQLHNQMVVWPRTYGPVFKMYMGPLAWVVITDPELTKEVGVRQFAKFRNRPEPPGAPANREATERRKWDILWSKGKYWAGIRAACEPLFHSESLRAYAPLMHEAIDGLLESLGLGQSEQKPVQVSSALANMSLEAVGTAAFGVHLDTRKDSPLVSAAQFVMSPPPQRSSLMLMVILVPELRRFWSFLASKLNKRTQMAQHKIGFLNGTSKALLKNTREQISQQQRADGGEEDEGFFGHAGSLTDTQLKGVTDREQGNTPSGAYAGGEREGQEAHRSVVPKPNSFFSKLIKSSNKETGEPLNDVQISTQGITFILAGYDTTSVGLSWTLYELAQNPAIQARVLAEVDAFGQGLPTLDDLPSFPFTEAVFCESLRLHPPVNPMFVQNRVAQQDVVVGGYCIPKGTTVIMNSLGQHADPRIFPEPEVFRPERFLKGSPDGPDSRHPFAWIPFGCGPHKCVGYRFAMEEAVFALVRMFQRYTFQLSASHHKSPPTAKTSITLAPDGGVWMTVKARSAATTSGSQNEAEPDARHEKSVAVDAS